MLKIGLTGGIGSGKSTVAAIFALLGIPIFNADIAAKQVMESDINLVNAIKQLLGQEAYQNKQLNKAYVASKVFGNPLLLEKLNALVHPVAIEAGWQWAAQQTSPYVIKEAALLFEAGSAAGLDYIIGVDAPQALRIQRAMHRDGATRQDILSRMARQIDNSLKMKLCNFVINNNEQQLIIPQILTIHAHILNLSAHSSK